MLEAHVRRVEGGESVIRFANALSVYAMLYQHSSPKSCIFIYLCISQLGSVGCDNMTVLLVCFKHNGDLDGVYTRCGM